MNIDKKFNKKKTAQTFFMRKRLEVAHNFKKYQQQKS